MIPADYLHPIVEYKTFVFDVYDQITGKQAILSSIYLQINGGSLFSPHIDYILIGGFDEETDAAVMEKPGRSIYS
jgi:uncharacterized protein with WD repeat